MSEKKRNFKPYLQPAFMVCVLLLAAASGGMSIAKNKFEMYLKKTPLPLKKSHELLDEDGMGSFKITAKQKIQNKEIVKALGTEDYIQWVVEDLEAPSDSAVKKFLLFITYYHMPDRVPHVPEECYTGGGFQKISSDGIVFKFSADNSNINVPARQLVFANKDPGYFQKLTEFPVLYFFKVNGEYSNSRGDARTILNKNIFGPSSYFSKVEIVFNQQGVTPANEEAVAASEKLVNVILPALENKFWPDWPVK
jgi:hypothetical protein